MIDFNFTWFLTTSPENCLKNLKNPVSILFFVDNGLFVTQSKSFLSNSLLSCSYNVISNLLSKFGLIVEYSKTEVFHFSRLHSPFNPPLLNLSSIGSPILYPKEFWKYLGFIFDRKLSFCQHINFYSNKAISTVKYMKILGNLVRDLISHQKYLLYGSCILLIALYSFQLWYYNRAHLSYPLKMLDKMQKSHYLDTRGFQNVPIIQLKSHCRACSHQPLSLKTQWEITTQSALYPKQPHSLISYET